MNPRSCERLQRRNFWRRDRQLVRYCLDYDDMIGNMSSITLTYVHTHTIVARIVCSCCCKCKSRALAALFDVLKYE